MSPPYMKLWIAEYLGDTTHLNAIEHGAYLLILMAMWRAGGKLPDDPARLAKIARCTPEEWAEVGPVVLEFFTRSRGRLTHKRIAKELASCADTSRKRSEAAQARVAKKGRNSKDVASANADAGDSKSTHSHSHSHSQNNPLTPLEGGEGKASRRKPRTPIPDGFPTPELIAEQQAKAREAGADISAAFQAERFRQWCLSKDQRYADWAAAWRNWMVKAIGDAPKVVTRKDVDMDRVWRLRMATFQRVRSWDGDWEAPPGKPGCIVPAHILREFGFEPTPSPATDPDKEAA